MMETKLINSLIRRKEWRMTRAKKKSTTPSLTFPFALFLNKTRNLAEKIDMRFGGSGIKQTCSIWFPGGFPSAP